MLSFESCSTASSALALVQAAISASAWCRLSWDRYSQMAATPRAHSDMH